MHALGIDSFYDTLGARYDICDGTRNVPWYLSCVLTSLVWCALPYEENALIFECDKQFALYLLLHKLRIN